ncbi:MAG: methylmalonyl-CoA epimerase [Candidatus Cloacimonetes bacterium]|nr:methylmalonyl-CoA epimerase [Candidatus Cloacimonadota bacterium]
MLKKIDHIGIAVKNLERGIELYRDILGVEPEATIDFPPEKVKIAFFPLGESSVELLQPTHEESAIHKFLEKRGEGIHHICYRVDDLNKAIEILVARGLKPLDSKPRNGAHNTRVVFFHPKDTAGHLIELSEKA